LNQSHDNIEFLIVGKVDDHNYYDHIKELAESGNAKITFTGHIEDMNSVFNAVDILVSFSGGSVMYEAMAWGKVVVSIGFVNQNTSTYLIDRKTAFVIEGNSLELAKEKIIDVLLDDKLFGSISHEASKLLKQNLLPKPLSKQVETLYESF
jgi:glycosyltransferase involved in cell wall biosynthesis